MRWTDFTAKNLTLILSITPYALMGIKTYREVSRLFPFKKNCLCPLIKVGAIGKLSGTVLTRQTSNDLKKA